MDFGEVDAAAAYEGKVSLPVLTDVGAIPWVADCLDQVNKQKKGVAVVGGQGTGKSIAIATALERHAENERTAEQNDPKYRRTRVVHVHRMKSKTQRDCIIKIWKDAFKREPHTKVRNRRKSDDELMDVLVEKLLNHRVSAIVFNEGESLSNAAFETMRDIISLTERQSKHRFTGEGEQREFSPAGVGILLVGTEALRGRILDSEERRWVRIETVLPVRAAKVSGVYRRFLPGFEEHISDIGEEAWARFLNENVTRGAPVAIGYIDDHVVNYIRRMRGAARAATPRVQIPFNKEVFMRTLVEARTVQRKRPEDQAA